MADVTVRPSTQIKVRLDTTPAISREIFEEFSFFVQGYKFMPAYKTGRWDGRVSMYDGRTKELPKGLLPRLKDWADDNGYTINVQDIERVKPQIPWDPTWLDKWDQYCRLPLREHQTLAISQSLRFNFSLIRLATGGGKSMVCYGVCRYLLENMDRDILVLVPSISLTEQLKSDFQDYQVPGWDAEDHVHLLYGGQERDSNKRIWVSTWQTAVKMPPAWFRRFGALIVDEAHGADSKSITKISDAMPHTPFRMGMTGTLEGTVIHTLEMQARFGRIVEVASSKELMELGVLAPLKIDVLRLQYSQEERQLAKHLDYQGEINFLVSNPRRNKLLTKLALTSQGNTLMLFNYIEKHGAGLYDELVKGAEAHGKKIYYIAGKTDVEDRDVIRKVLEKENNAILLASYGTLAVGVNIKNLHNLIFAHPYKAKVRVLQSIGRALRTAAGKDGAKLIDIIDDLSTASRGSHRKANAALNHGIERLKLYDAEGFDYKVLELPMPPRPGV